MSLFSLFIFQIPPFKSENIAAAGFITQLKGTKKAKKKRKKILNNKKHGFTLNSGLWFIFP